jgi:hypothetical protein
MGLGPDLSLECNSIRILLHWVFDGKSLTKRNLPGNTRYNIPAETATLSMISKMTRLSTRTETGKASETISISSDEQDQQARQLLRESAELRRDTPCRSTQLEQAAP